MFSLNLLPWRLEQHQKAFRRFMWQGFIWLACSVLIVIGLNQLNEQQGQALSQTKEKLTQITHLTLNAKQIVLSGMTESQQEFEEIHQFLKRHFTEVNLTKFQPVQQQLFFQFDIHLSESVQ